MWKLIIPLLGLIPCVAMAQSMSFGFSQLNTGIASQAAAINNAGQVAGSAQFPGSAHLEPVLWTPREIAQAPSYSALRIGRLPGSVGGQATHLNAHGAVVGNAWYELGTEMHTRPFIWNSANGLMPLPLPDAARQGEVQQIANNGTMVGSILHNGGFFRAVVWNALLLPQQLQPFPGDQHSRGLLISQDGSTALCHSWKRGESPDNGTFYQVDLSTGKKRALGAGPFSRIQPLSMTTPAAVVGYGWSGGFSRAIRWTENMVESLDTNERFSYATGDNAGDLAVGYAGLTQDGSAAPLLFRNGVAHEMNRFLPSTVRTATLLSLNEAGTLTGTLRRTPAGRAERSYGYVLNPYITPLRDIVTPTDVRVGGTPAYARVRISTVPRIGAAEIHLSSSHPAVQVPSTVTIEEGKTSAQFKFTSSPVSTITTVTITASHGESVVSNTVTLRPIGVARATTTSTSVQGGTSITASGILELGAAPEAIPITIQVSRPDLVTPNRTTALVALGRKVANFKLATKPVTTPTEVTVRLTANGISKEVKFTLLP
jgi:hypothetical protein